MKSKIPILYRLITRIIERHGKDGADNLQHVKPWNGDRFRDGLTVYNIVKRGKPIVMYMLWYVRDIGGGKMTSQAVRLRKVVR